MVGVLHDRKHLHLGERGLAAALVIKRRDTHKPVRALLHRQLAVEVITVHNKGGGLNAGLLGVGDVVDVHLVASLFRPTYVHAHEHLRPVRRVYATGAGADVDHGLALVVFAGEHGLHLERIDLRCHVRQLVVGHRGVAFFFGEFVHDRQVVDTRAQRRDLLQPRLHIGKLSGHLLCVRRIVPQRRVAGLGLEFAGALAEHVEVHHLLDSGKCGRKILNPRLSLGLHNREV